MMCSIDIHLMYLRSPASSPWIPLLKMRFHTQEHTSQVERALPPSITQGYRGLHTVFACAEGLTAYPHYFSGLWMFLSYYLNSTSVSLSHNPHLCWTYLVESIKTRKSYCPTRATELSWFHIARRSTEAFAQTSARSFYQQNEWTV